MCAAFGKAVVQTGRPHGTPTEKSKNLSRDAHGSDFFERRYFESGQGLRLLGGAIAAAALGVLLIFHVLRAGLGFFLVVFLVLLVLVFRVRHFYSPPLKRCVRQSRSEIAWTQVEIFIQGQRTIQKENAAAASMRARAEEGRTKSHGYAGPP